MPMLTHRCPLPVRHRCPLLSFGMDVDFAVWLQGTEYSTSQRSVRRHPRYSGDDISNCAVLLGWG